MRIDIHSKGFPLSKALTHFVRKRLRRALGVNAGRIVDSQVRLSDINGPRGGVDKCCLLRLQLPGASSVVVRNTSNDMYSAIAHAVNRAAISINRRIGRANRVRRRARARVAAGFDKFSLNA